MLADSDYRAMVNAIGDYAVIRLSPEGTILSWNEGARRLKAYEAEEIIGRHFSILYPQEAIDRQWPDRELSAAAEMGRFEDEGWRLRKDGSRFWANVVFTRLTDEAGNLRGFVKITRDLTQRRQQQELLRMSEERFRLLVDGVVDYAIFMLDPDGHIASWNPGAQKTKGYTAAEIIGRHFSVFYPPDVAAAGWPAEELRRALRDGRHEDDGWRLRKDGSRFWASVVITALYDARGTHRGYAKIARDLTDKRRISALEDEGRRITMFLAMLGHELRNPLAPISNALSLMQREQELPTHLKNARDIIGRQIRQITHLVDDLLDVGRITSGKIHLDLQPLNLHETVAEAVESVQPLFQRRSHHFRLIRETEDLWIAGDRTRVIQVVGNLLANAAKFTPVGGEIELSISHRPPHAAISIKDNGPGIAPAMLPHVFELFYQGEQDPARSQGGLGLGLSLVHQLVALHAGDVSAYSTGRPGEGSEFVVRLPTTTARSASAGRLAPATQESRHAQILVVDDNRDSADTLQLLLESVGYQTAVAYDGRSALETIRTARPHVVLMDIGLPDMNGLEVMQQLANETDRPHAIAISGYGQDGDRAASASVGFRAHLTKPVDIQELLPLIEALVPAKNLD